MHRMGEQEQTNDHNLLKHVKNCGQRRIKKMTKKGEQDLTKQRCAKLIQKVSQKPYNGFKNNYIEPNEKGKFHF